MPRSIGGLKRTFKMVFARHSIGIADIFRLELDVETEL